VAITPGRGLVDLGLGSATNSLPADAKTDAQSSLTPGLISLRMAPTHHGLESYAYAVVSEALSGEALDHPLEGSAIVARVPQNRLPFDPLGLTPIAFSSPYPGLPDNRALQLHQRRPGSPGAAPAALAVDPGLSSATMIQVAFADRLGRKWLVLMDPAQATTGFVLPTPTAMPDRTFWDGTSSGARSSMRVDALALGDASPIAFQRWVELGSGNPARLIDFTTSFSFVDSGRPTVSWLTPTSSGATLAKGSTVTVKVAHFKVGTAVSANGFVRVSFVGGTNCPSVDATIDASMGLGEIDLALPINCAGINVVMTATLFDQAGSALAPGVFENTTVTIQ